MMMTMIILFLSADNTGTSRPKTRFVLLIPPKIICSATGISTRIESKVLQVPSVTAVCTDIPSFDNLLYVTALEGRIDIIVNLKPCGKAIYRITIMVTTT